MRPDEQGREVTVREVLDGARTRLEEGEFRNDPETEASLALVLGHSYESLGRYSEAHALIARSLDLRRSLFDGDDRRVYDALYRLGTVMWKEGVLDEALAVREELAAMTARTGGTTSPDHAESLSNLGNTYADLGDLGRAVEYLEQAVEAARAHTGEEAELGLARYVNNLGTVYFDQEEFGRAAGMFEEALEIRGRLLGEESDVYAITLVNLGNARLNQGELGEAERILARTVALEEEVFGDDHPSTAYAYSALGEAILRQGRTGEAEAWVRRALAIREATAVSAYWRVASERRHLAQVLIASGRVAEAEAQLDTAWAGLVAAGETGRPQAFEVATLMTEVQSRMGRPDRAAAWGERAAGSRGVQAPL